MDFDIDAVRTQFPAVIQDTSRIFLDNPAGTQVCLRAVEQMRICLLEANANLGGAFATSVRAQAMIDESRRAAADFLGASHSDQIVFGANMTTLTFQFAKGMGKMLSFGDEIILSRMDHDANVQPWLLMARERGLVVKWLDFDQDTFELRVNDLDTLCTPKTRLIAVGYASNVLGTIHPVHEIVKKAQASGIWTYIDAVHYAPHGPIDVGTLGCDFLVCSAYKFYGPHIGVLYGRRDLLEALDVDKVRPAPNTIPERFEVGTQNHERLAGMRGARAS